MVHRKRYGAIVIGGGVNGLTCATLLAKMGVRTLLLEQRAELGGCAAEGEIAPGFTAPTLAHSTGPVRRDVVRGGTEGQEPETGEREGEEPRGGQGQGEA